MKPGTLEFDGVEYLDGTASDPRLLATMAGAPPPADKRVRFEDDRFLSVPEIRWALSHMRELVATANVPRGSATPSDLGRAAPSTEAALDSLSFTDMNGRQRSWGTSLSDTYTDGILVMHRGRRVYERYFGEYEALAARRTALRPLLTSWINLYRIDDYIGTEIADANGKMIVNGMLGPGGHTDYWVEPALIEAVFERRLGATVISS